jgi:hypothetical protein
MIRFRKSFEKKNFPTLIVPTDTHLYIFSLPLVLPLIINNFTPKFKGPIYNLHHMGLSWEQDDPVNETEVHVWLSMRRKFTTWSFSDSVWYFFFTGHVSVSEVQVNVSEEGDETYVILTYVDTYRLLCSSRSHGDPIGDSRNIRRDSLQLGLVDGFHLSICISDWRRHTWYILFTTDSCWNFLILSFHFLLTCQGQS